MPIPLRKTKFCCPPLCTRFHYASILKSKFWITYLSSSSCWYLAQLKNNVSLSFFKDSLHFLHTILKYSIQKEYNRPTFLLILFLLHIFAAALSMFFFFFKYENLNVKDGLGSFPKDRKINCERCWSSECG